MGSRVMVFVCMAAISVVMIGGGCGGDKVLVVQCFPTDIGNWWEYEFLSLIVVYDTVSNDTSEYLYVNSLRDEIDGMDQLSGWQCYRFNQTWVPHIRWFAHPDTAFLFIAQIVSTDSSTSSQPLGGLCFIVNGITFHSPGELASYFRYLLAGIPWDTDLDTLYITPPHKWYVYPLSVGRSWVKMTDPWYEEREVVAEDSVTVSAGDFHALKVRVTSDITIDLYWSLWIAEQGMIRDSMYAPGIATNAVGDTIGYFDSYTIRELISYHIE
ncbi:hypothetical protein IBX73_00425 [candidate division WOR-3 bacterium]|nr:hypothetical protein [candidate division WOR-3 bacterium]